MDISSIIVAALALIGTLAGSWGGVRQANKLVNWRIDKLEKKVDAHNHLVERMMAVEKDIQLIKEEINNGTKQV